MSVTIYHNPACGTSRNTLAMIRQSGEEPIVIEYLKTPPTREKLKELIETTLEARLDKWRHEAEMAGRTLVYKATRSAGAGGAGAGVVSTVAAVGGAVNQRRTCDHFAETYDKLASSR